MDESRMPKHILMDGIAQIEAHVTQAIASQQQANTLQAQANTALENLLIESLQARDGVVPIYEGHQWRALRIQREANLIQNEALRIYLQTTRSLLEQLDAEHSERLLARVIPFSPRSTPSGQSSSRQTRK